MTLEHNIQWIEKNHSVKVSKFMKTVLYILDVTYYGLHHTDCMNQWKGKDYCQTDSITYELNSCQELATYDYSHLTTLVLLCHEKGIRLAINVEQNGKRRNRALYLTFNNRMGKRPGKYSKWKYSQSHPTIYDAIRRLKEHEKTNNI